MISVKNLSKSYDGRQVLNGLSLELPEKGIVRIMGKSGQGKTTLLNIIAGLIKLDSGEVQVGGNVSMVFQEDRLLEWDSALENVRLTVSHGRSAEKILSELGLGEELNTKVKELSGGMARRVAIARALVREADIYIMDEPLRGLDEETAGTVINTILKYTEGKLLLVVTHDPAEFCDAEMTVNIS